MNDLQKSLAELIDETLAEIETLKKSERYSAHEIELGEAKANGSMDTKVEKSDDEDEDDEEKEEDEAKKSDDEDEDDEEDSMSKAEADMKKAEEACEKAMKKYEMCKAEADHKKKMLAMKKGEDKKEDKEEKKDEEKELKKSIEARVAPLESKIADVLAAVKKIAEAPVAARGTSYRQVQPLAKSQQVEPLNKTAVFNKLFELKKSGTTIPTEEFFELESGTVTPEYIANKYGIK
jgi:hypothetical protein